MCHAEAVSAGCSVTPSQFNAELGKDLKPRLEKTGDQGLLPQFLDYFKDKSLSYLSQLLALWEGADCLSFSCINDELVMLVPNHQVMKVPKCQSFSKWRPNHCFEKHSRRSLLLHPKSHTV